MQLNSDFYAMRTEIHIGKAIEDRIRELGMIKKHISEVMNMSPQNLNSIFRSPAIRTDLLEQFSIVLRKNFFTLYKGIGNELDEMGAGTTVQIRIDNEGQVSDETTSKKIDYLLRKLDSIEKELKATIHNELEDCVQKMSKSKK